MPSHRWIAPSPLAAPVPPARSACGRRPRDARVSTGGEPHGSRHWRSTSWSLDTDFNFEVISTTNLNHARYSTSEIV
jgi:hypothetical protein